MTSILITTHVANFFMTLPSISLDNQVAWAKSHAEKNPERHVVVRDEQGTVVYQSGPQSLVPCIWTHTPVPMGMPIEAIKKRFEERAVSVLHDHLLVPDFSTDPEWADGRYKYSDILSAWVMYLDLAIEQYTTAL